ncbi:TlpA family protein disulfide reductase [Sphingobacterium sp. R2]|uniref:TlpA family protein disulfide reductase n=1 Tax=Sphingobacterium sp. R2 TaxID=3112958 RepID=UPI00345DFE9D
MKMKINLLSLIILYFFNTVYLYAQDQDNNALQIGDKFEVQHKVKAITGEINFTSLKPDLVILDFFMTNCTACIEAFPKNNRLQVAFGNTIKILPISPESRAVVSIFFKKNAYTKTNKLDVVVEDNTFKNLFPHKGYPHVVWIYKGKVIAITAGDMVTKKSIEEILAGKTTKEWPIKNDFEELQFFDGNADLTSTLSAYKNGLPSTYQRDTIGEKIRYKMTNVSLLPALYYAYSNVRKLPLMKKERVKLIDLDETDFLDYQAESKSQWLKDHGFCYESFWPLSWTEEQRVNALVADMTNRMRLNVSFALEDSEIWLVTKRSANNSNKPSDGMGIKMACTLLEINNPDFPPIILDVNDTSEKVKLGAVTDYVSFKNTMQAIGFTVSKEERMIEKIVIKNLAK